MADAPHSYYLLGLGLDKPRQDQPLDRIEQAKLDFSDLYGQIVYLADRLSKARILVGHAQCSMCPRYSHEECRRCWMQEAAKAAREGRHAS